MNPELKNKYDSLPNDVKQAIDSSDVALKLEDLGKKYDLHMDQIGILEEEVGKVMLGITHPDEFVDVIEQKLNIDTDKAIALTTDVNMEIFLSIRESLIKMHDADSET